MKEYETIFDNLSMEVRETQDEFIFSTISNYIERECNVTISKTELIQAITLYRMYKEHGYDISERWTTATHQSVALSDAYNRGFQDGVEKEHNKVLELLDRLEEEKKRRGIDE